MGKYSSRIVIMGLFVFLVHGAKLHSNVIGIDTEDIIRLQEDFYPGWLQSGRQGLVLLKMLLGTYDFNPYFAGMMTVLLLLAVPGAFLLLWDQKAGFTGDNPGMVCAWLACGCLWVSHPALTEQLYFSLQSLEICAGMLLTALALYLTGRGNRKKAWFWMLAGALLVLTFSMYQIFVVMYIFGAVSVLLLQYQRSLQESVRDALSVRSMMLGVCPYAGTFLAAFGVNCWITGRFFSERISYVSGQIQWGCIPLRENILRIGKHGLSVCTGWASLHYNAAFGLLCAGAVAVAVLFVRKYCRGRKGVGCVWLLLVLALLSMPFWMTFLCGGAPVIRSQLVLPAVTGFLAYFCIQTCIRMKGKRPVFLWIFCGISLLGIWIQSQVTLRLYYTDSCRYEQDAALGRELITKLKEVSGEGRYPLVIVGSRPFEPNNACVMGEIIGYSFFDYDLSVEPEGFWNSRRVVGLLHTLGYRINHASREDTARALEDSVGMPVWPGEGSVRLINDVIVVKLSDRGGE